MQNIICNKLFISNRFFWILPLYALFAATSGFADEDVTQVCGISGEVLTGETTVNLEGKAKSIARLAEADLKGTVNNYKNEIEVSATRSDSARELHYLNHISCVLIYQDPNLKTDEKLQRIKMLGEALKPTQPSSSPQASVPTPGVVYNPKHSCMDYMLEHPDEAACNGATDDGYYWRIRQKLYYYSKAGAYPAAYNDSPCDKNRVNTLAQTARDPLVEPTFQPVKALWKNHPGQSRDETCNYDGNGKKIDDMDRSKVCGIFEVICTEQKW